MIDPDVERTGADRRRSGYESPSFLRRLYYRLNRGRAESLLQAAIKQYKSGDRPQALATCRRAAHLGNNQARHNLGMAILSGELVPRDLEQGLAWLRCAGCAGHLLSMQTLGRLYATGDGVPKNVVLAMMWFEQAARRGDAHSQLVLGLQYLEGKYTPVDDQKAFQWLRQAAEQGEPTACSTLGVCFENGRGVPQDVTEAFLWQLRAAQLGNTIGQYNAGRHYIDGIGTTVDLSAGAAWFSRGAEGGDANAQFNLGRCFMRGHGLAQDSTRAVRWFTAAAAQGHALAKIYWAGTLADGTAGPPDRTLALKLLDEAEAAGEDVAEVRSAVLAAALSEHTDLLARLRKTIVPDGPDEHDDVDAHWDELDAPQDRPTPFRRTCCFFAFYLVPEWLFDAHQPESPITTAQIQARVPEMWSEAARLDEASNVYVSKPDGQPTCREESSWVVIEMPVHGLPPEPRCMLIDLSAFPARVLLVESFLTRDARGLLCSVDTQQAHMVHGLLPNRDPTTVLVACAADRLRPALPPVDGSTLLRHLTLYAEAHSDLERGRGAR